MSITATLLERAAGHGMRLVERSAPGFAPWLGAIDDVGHVGAGARPIVIQGGLSSQSHAYMPMKRILESKGFTVYVTQLPRHGWASAKRDAAELGKTVSRALRETGADKATVIGHSKGGLSARWYLQRMGGVEHVAQLITLGTPHHGVAPFGTRLAALGAEMPNVRALKELAAGSPFVRTLDDDFAAFMARARSHDPEFRVTSIMADLGGGGDGLVPVASSRMPALEGVDNILITSGPRDHMQIAAQGRYINRRAMRSVVELAASSRTPNAVHVA